MRKILDWFRRSRVDPLEPFPGEWASFLWDHSAQYRRLPDRLRTAFERDVQRFIAKKRITGIETEVDEPLRFLVAASAAALSVGWPRYPWSELSEVLLYPESFDREYRFGRPELAGQAHVWGTVILSVPALRHSFAYYEDPYHVGLHEFAHLLMFDRGQHISVPVGLSPANIQLWEAIQAHELERIVRGESIIRDYALQPLEFFPCAVEVFFQKPIELRDCHRRLYQFLSPYFRQRPALWGVEVLSSMRLAARGDPVRYTLRFEDAAMGLGRLSENGRLRGEAGLYIPREWFFVLNERCGSLECAGRLTYT